VQTIHAIHTVCGPILSIAVPPEMEGKQVEVLVTALEIPSLSDEERQARLRRALAEKPKLSPELARQLAENPDLLRGSVLRYDGPFGPACPPEDWDVIGNPENWEPPE